MRTNRISKVLAFLGAGLMSSACSDRAATPTGVGEGGSSLQPHHSMLHTTADVSALALEPFTFRAPLDPYRIHQLPDFLMHSKERTDIVIQRSVFAPGAGPWHTHPGPSFVYVIEGEIKLERFTRKDGCTESPVFTPGKAYFEVADEVHRAVVVSAVPAVLLVTRFNIPVGGAIAIPAADPGC
jgi:quercetin dioxygenase-like cupin family protein